MIYKSRYNADVDTQWEEANNLQLTWRNGTPIVVLKVRHDVQLRQGYSKLALYSITSKLYTSTQIDYKWKILKSHA